MYLETLKIENFRKYENLEVKFTNGLNLIIGENDSGKTAIIDAIKYVLHTQSYDYIRPCYEDFYLENTKDENERSTKFKIECIFRDFEDYEAKNFLEWLTIGDDGHHYLKIWLEGTRKGSKVFYDLRAGADDEGSQISGEARDYLRTTYLRPLRDAQSELTPKKGSRLSQILDNHEEFSNKDKHPLKDIMETTNEDTSDYFVKGDGKKILEDINQYLSTFSLESNSLNSKFQVSENSLKSVLEKLSLKLFNNEISENNIQGLGSQNLLYISAELLLLKKAKYSGLKLALIEEIEAHLHPQTQIRLIEAIQKIGDDNNIQFILTSHSPNLASKVKLKNLILCKNGQTYPMGSEYTQLDKGDYLFLERFLDSTKANLFFANGVILVEGDAENILIPTLAKLMGRDLSKHGVSIVNVGSIAFLRYANIFLREEEPKMNIPISLITDVDVKPFECKEVFSIKICQLKANPNLFSLSPYPVNTIKEYKKKNYKIEREYTLNEVNIKRLHKIQYKKEYYNKEKVKSFIAPYWTLEYTIALSCLSRLLSQAIYICWKTKSKDYIYTDIEMQQFIIEANTEYDSWLSGSKSIEYIAFEIYNNRLNKSTNKLSKAVVAQVFAQILNDTDLTLYDIKNDDKLKYIVDAINYATGSK